jgi:hypothetical protein
MFSFFLLKFAIGAMTMLENLHLDKRKNNFTKLSENLNVLSIFADLKYYS